MTFIGALQTLVFGSKPDPGAIVLAPAQPSSSAIDVYKDDQVPVYPDAGTPLPAVHPRRLLEKHEPLIKEIQNYSSLNKEDFRDLMYPVLLRYAEIVHLLPASESHHHCGVGGLLRHGLEVCRNAIVAAKGIEFALDHYPSQRERVRPRWRVAAMVGGLCHDLGKPIVDIGALSPDGQLEWNPHRETLWSWLERNKLKDYRLRWRTGARHKRHEWFNAIPLYRLIPPHTLEWLCDGVDQQPLDSLIAALAGALDTNNPLVDLLRLADSKSVEKDLQDSRQRLAATAMGGQRNLAARIIRTIHDRLENNAWKCNKPGELIWVTTEGVFALFPAIIREAVAVLREQGEASLPHDTTPILQMLADLGALQTHISQTGQQHYTVMVRYHAQDRKQPMIFDAQSIQFIGNDILPRSLILPEPVQIEVSRPGKQAPADSPSPAAPTPPLPTPPNAPVAAPAAASPAPPQPQAEPEAAPPSSMFDDQATAAIEEEGSTEPTLDPAAQPPVHEQEEETPSPETAAQSDADSPLRDRRREPDVRDEMLRDAYDHMHGQQAPDTPQAAANWFATQDTEGAWLLSIAERVATGELQEGRDVIEDDEHIHLAVMACLKNLGLEIAMVREALEAREWTLPDPRNPRRKTMDLNGPAGKRVNCIRLRPDIGNIFKLLLPVRGVENVNHIERARRNHVRPLGPYLDGHAAANIRDLRATSAEDGVWVRPSFHAFLSERAGESGLPASELSPKDVWQAISDFIAAHQGIDKPWLLFHLKHGANPVVAIEREERTKKSVYVVNPAYRMELDIKEQSGS